MLRIEELAIAVTNICLSPLIFHEFIRINPTKPIVKRTFLVNQCIAITVFFSILVLQETTIYEGCDETCKVFTAVVRLLLTIELFWCALFPLLNFSWGKMLDIEDTTLQVVRRMVLLSWSISFATALLCWLLKWKLYSILFLYNLFAVWLFTFLKLVLREPHNKTSGQLLPSYL